MNLIIDVITVMRQVRKEKAPVGKTGVRKTS